jgi:hypothetical protein
LSVDGVAMSGNLQEPNVPVFASRLIETIESNWSQIRPLAQCLSHTEMCTITGARITREISRKLGNLSKNEQFEEFKLNMKRFTPPTTSSSSPLDNNQIPSPVEKFSKLNLNFDFEFSEIIQKINWNSPKTVSSVDSRKRKDGLVDSNNLGFKKAKN